MPNRKRSPEQIIEPTSDGEASQKTEKRKRHRRVYTKTRESRGIKNLHPSLSLSEILPQQKPLVMRQPTQPDTDLMSVHTDSDIANQGTREIPQAEYDHKSSDYERTHRVAEILPDPPLETIEIPIVKAAAVSVNQNSEMQNQKITEYSHTLSEVPEPMKAIPKITNIEVIKSPKIKFQKPEITVISEKSKFSEDPAENPRVKNQGY
ncbi:hypothetical protein QAD02_013427 [Eretmocerus hayati]|uniref:Uncharacterized protein n=1 Tax=Eretmocerus hayati TaxID=131215 RepID=A0ACC2P782_9HYME|nr:hypothetical protein QAD02_013427 [Eretmocerus hayati]